MKVLREMKKEEEKERCDDEVETDDLKEMERGRSLGNLVRKRCLEEEERDGRLFHQQRLKQNRKNVWTMLMMKRVMKKETWEDKKTS